MSPTKSPYDLKIDRTYHIIHGEGGADSDTWNDLRKKLEAMGADTDELLKEASFEDIAAGLDVPALKAKLIAKVWRGQDNPRETAAEHEAGIMMHKPVSQWPIELLIKQCDPTKPLSPVMMEMTKRLGSNPVMVFGPKGDFRSGATLKQISLLEQGLPITEFVDFDGMSGRAYAVGFGPFRIKEACPLHTDMPLVEGRCVKCQKTWGSIELEKRRYAYFAAQLGLVKADDRQQVTNLFNMLKGNMGDFKDTYPEAINAYFDSEKKDELPGLKVDIGADGVNGSNSPFGKNKKY